MCALATGPIGATGSIGAIGSTGPIGSIGPNSLMGIMTAFGTIGTIAATYFYNIFTESNKLLHQQKPSIEIITNNDFSEDCSICLGRHAEKVGILSCNHKFHQACIEIWLEVKNSCPICRKSQNLALE